MRNLLQRLFAVAIALMAATTMSAAHEIKLGDLVIADLWTRATPGGAKVAGGYLTITNKGKTADRLLAVSSPVAGKAEVHEMATTNGVMTMRPLDGGLVIEPGKTVTLAPGGLHLMFTEIKSPLKEGEKFPVTLKFEKAGTTETFLHVQSIGAQGLAGKGHEHSGMKM